MEAGGEKKRRRRGMDLKLGGCGGVGRGGEEEASCSFLPAIKADPERER